MTKPNLTEYAAATDRRLDGIEAGIQALLEKAGVKPAKTTTAKKAKKETTVSDTKVRTLTKKTRLAFVKKHDWATGLSVAAISTLLLSGEQEAPGWKVATFREAKAAGVTTGEFVAARGAAAGDPARSTAPKQDLSLLTYAQLYAEAQAAKVKGRSNMNSAALIAALS